jgi:hypothetical protein
MGGNLAERLDPSLVTGLKAVACSQASPALEPAHA